MKCRFPFCLHPAVIGLLFVPLLPIGKVQAASVTLRNEGGYVASFEIEGCGNKINVGDIPLWQERTVDLAAFPCANTTRDRPSFLDGESVLIRVFYHWWWWRDFSGIQPGSLTKIKGDVWRLNDGTNKKRVTQGEIRLVMRGVAWEPQMDPYSVSSYLAGVDLSGANLSGANLAGADLTRADFTGADLGGYWNGWRYISKVITDATTICPNGSAGPCW